MPDQTATAAKQFTITRVFDAPRELVWRAWTDPDEAPYWLHPRGIITPREQVDFDVRPGGRYRYTMVAADGTEYPTVGTYREVSPPERLVFTWGSPGDADDDMPLITVDLAAHGLAGDADPPDVPPRRHRRRARRRERLRRLERGARPARGAARPTVAR